MQERKYIVKATDLGQTKQTIGELCSILKVPPPKNPLVGMVELRCNSYKELQIAEDVVRRLGFHLSVRSA